MVVTTHFFQYFYTMSVTFRNSVGSHQEFSSSEKFWYLWNDDRQRQLLQNAKTIFLNFLQVLECNAAVVDHDHTPAQYHHHSTFQRHPHHQVCKFVEEFQNDTFLVAISLGEVCSSSCFFRSKPFHQKQDGWVCLIAGVAVARQTNSC